MYLFVLLDRLLITLVFHELMNVSEIVPELPAVLLLILLIISDIIQIKSPPMKSVLFFIFFIHIRSNRGQTNQRRW